MQREKRRYLCTSHSLIIFQSQNRNVIVGTFSWSGINSVSSSCWVLPLPGADVPCRASRPRGEGGRSVCVLMLRSGITALGKRSGDQAIHPWIPAVIPEGQQLSRCLGWVSGCFLAGTSSRPGCALPALRQLEAVLGRGGCGRAGIVFLCHRKQLPGVSQAGLGLPVSLVEGAVVSKRFAGRAP